MINLLFDLRHPWWTFTREIALIHCQRTGQKLVRADSSFSVYNINPYTVGEVEAFAEAQRQQRGGQKRD